MCTGCFNVACDPMASHSPAAEKMARRRKAGQCIACGKLLDKCSCKAKDWHNGVHGYRLTKKQIETKKLALEKLERGERGLLSEWVVGFHIARLRREIRTGRTKN